MLLYTRVCNICGKCAFISYQNANITYLVRCKILQTSKNSDHVVLLANMSNIHILQLAFQFSLSAMCFIKKPLNASRSRKHANQEIWIMEHKKIKLQMMQQHDVLQHHLLAPKIYLKIFSSRLLILHIIIRRGEFVVCLGQNSN